MGLFSALIGLGGSLLGNRSRRKGNEEQYQRSRADYLEDRKYEEGRYDLRRQHAREDLRFGHREDNLGLSNRISMLGRNHGLTPQEVMGSPAAGGNSGGGPTLGQSGAQSDAARANAVSAARDRETTLKAESIRSETALNVAAINNATALGQSVIGAKTQRYQTDTQAQTAQRGQDVQQIVANISAEAGKYSARQIAGAQIAAAKIQQSTALAQLAQKKIVDGAQIKQIAAQTGLLLQDAKFKADIHAERWSKLTAQMGPDNMAMVASAAMFGIPLDEIMQGINPGQLGREQLSLWYDFNAGTRSSTYRDAAGSHMSLKKFPTQGNQENVLGRSSGKTPFGFFR